MKKTNQRLMPNEPLLHKKAIKALLPLLTSLIEQNEQLDNKLVAERDRSVKSERKAVTDPLTGLPNGIAYLETLRKLFANHKRFLDRHDNQSLPDADKPQLAVIYIDLDRLKSFNDISHDVGDLAIQAVAQAIKIVRRDGDYAFRKHGGGGDEFVLLCPLCDAAGARDIADRIREILRTTSIGQVQGKQVTISAGAASMPADGSSLECVVQVADSRLIFAKENGRDQVCSTDR